MRKRAAALLMTLVAFTGLGSRYGYEQRCRGLALEIVKTWFENSPILPIDIERIEAFEELGCSENFLEIERQRILRGEVEPWVEVVQS